MIKGFRDFLLRGNVVELAVAVVIGAAFAAVVDGFIAAFIDPLLAILLGGAGQALSSIMLGVFPIGIFISAVVNFILKGAVVYFFIVRPFASFAAKMAANTPPPDDIALLTEIRDALKGRPGEAGRR